MTYIGRFAPSPTGPLHFGSLLAAVASYCDAKANNGLWLLRMEDLDKPREIAGAASDILTMLAQFGFAWDGKVMYQSQRQNAYEAALDALKQAKLAYACSCSRKEVADSSTQIGIEGAIYNKNCLLKTAQFSAENMIQKAAWRLNTAHDLTICNCQFIDLIQGLIVQDIPNEVGDFVLKRADALFAYQLAVVVDDAAQNITHVVRGADLLNSTPRQILLQHLLDFSTPQYAHIPIIVNATGEKLSKQTLAAPILAEHKIDLIFSALLILGQNPPLKLKSATLNELWCWAIEHWQLKAVPKTRTVAPEAQTII